MALSSFMAPPVQPTQTMGLTIPQAQVNQYRSTAPAGTTQVMGSLEAFLAPGSSYIENARRRGIEQAAMRGGVNSSIAAGASERAAIEAAAPLAQQALGIEQAREQVNMENWMSTQNFNRGMQGFFQQGVFNNSMDMLKMIQNMALQDPELYSPEVTSGYSNFFNQNMKDILGRYFG